MRSIAMAIIMCSSYLTALCVQYKHTGDALVVDAAADRKNLRLFSVKIGRLGVRKLIPGGGGCLVKLQCDLGVFIGAVVHSTVLHSHI